MARVPSLNTPAQMHALGQLKRQLRALDPYSDRKYLRDFSEAFNDYERLVTDSEFQSRLRSASLVYVGDYHALARSQQFAAEVVEFLASTGREVVLGMETFFSSDQAALDCWQYGARTRTCEMSLREEIRFEHEWGYPWEPVCELLSRARAVGVRVAGLDRNPRLDLRSIGRRDRHAAERIASLRAEYADAVIVVLFGESHLAPGHLPAQVTKALGAGSVAENSLTLLQNVDTLYWHAVSRDRVRQCRCNFGEMVPAVRVNNDVICVFNASPLEKYESYRACLERWCEG